MRDWFVPISAKVIAAVGVVSTRVQHSIDARIREMTGRKELADNGLHGYSERKQQCIRNALQLRNQPFMNDCSQEFVV